MRVTGVAYRPTAAAAGPDTGAGTEPVTTPTGSLRDADAAGLTQKRAATLLGVSVGWLRHSNCPKVLLPGNGPKGKPMLRYFRDDVLAWAKTQAASDTPTQDGTRSTTVAAPASKRNSDGNSGDVDPQAQAGSR